MKFVKVMLSLIVLSVSIFVMLPSKTIDALAENGSLSVDINTTTASILTGQEIRLNVDYGFSNLQSGYTQAQLVVTVPTQVNVTSIVASDMPIAYTDGTTQNLSPVISGNTITYTVPTGKSVAPGYASRVELIKVTTSKMLTLPGTVTPTATLSATAGTNMAVTDQEPVLIRITPDWRVIKTPQFTTYNQNTYARYRMYIQAPNNNGNIAAKSFVVTDVIPANMSFVGFDSPTDPRINEIYPSLIPSDSNTWQGAKPQPYTSSASFPPGNVLISGNTITWTIPDTGVIYTNSSYLEVTYWVKINDNILTTPGVDLPINNTANLSAVLLNNQAYTNSSNATISVVDDAGDPNNVPDKKIHFVNGYGTDTDTVYFNLPVTSLYNRSSTVDLINFVIEDQYPNWSDALTLKDVLIPSMNTGNSASPYLSYKFEYLKNGVVVSTYNYSTNTSRRITAPISSDGYRITFATIPRGTGGTGSSLSPIIVGFTLDDTKLDENQCVYNRADFSYNFAGTLLSSQKSSECVPLIDVGAASVGLSKQIVSPKSFYQYDDIITFRVNYNNSLYSGKNVEGAVFHDLLPKELKFIPGSTVGPVEIIDVIENFNSSGKQKVSWRLLNPLVPNTSGSFTFQAYVTESIDTLNYTNDVYMMATTPLDSDLNFTSYPKDTEDLNQNGDKNEPAIKASVSFQGVKYSGILIIKEVKGDLDTDWSRYPLNGQVSAAGQFEYRITVKNFSSQAMSNIRFIDILPYVGDTGVLVPTARDSQWTPSLKAAITPPSGVNINYSTSNNPNRGPIGRPGIGEASTSWLTSAPSDITTVRSLKVEYPGTLNANGTFVFNYSMISPVGSPSNGEIAWNSFGLQAQSTGGVQTLPVEPKKVGISTVPPIKGAISGRTFLDENRNGIQDIEDVGLNGILVYLLDSNGQRVMVGGQPVYTVTSNNLGGQPGYYQFNNLDQGQYRVEFVQMPGYGLVENLDISDPLNSGESDYDVLTRKTNAFSVGEAIVTNIDGGFSLGQIGDFVFNDVNRNGIQDSGEVGIAGITLKLFSGGVEVASTTTNTQGYYSFNHLLAGDYEVRMTKPTLMQYSQANQGSDDTLDSDFESMSLQIAHAFVSVVFDAKQVIQTNLTVDEGLSIGDGRITGQIWKESRRDNVFGIKAAGGNNEDIIPGITLNLYNSEMVLVATTTSDAFGQYEFSQLPPDQYKVEVSYPTNYGLVVDHYGADTTIDSDFIQTSNLTNPISLAIGQTVPHIDAGLFEAPSGKIGGHIYLDDNQDCTQSIDEVDFAGLQVELYDVDSQHMIATTLSDPNGNYLFEHVGAGSYEVRFITASGSIYKIGNVEAVTTNLESTLDIQVDLPDTNSQNLAVPTNGVCIQNRESGLGDYVWLDLNRNGLQDVHEQGLADVVVNLRAGTISGPVVQTVTTDATGFYYFTNVLPLEDYVIEFVLPSTDYQFTQANVLDELGGLSRSSLAIVSGDPLIASIPIFNLAPNQTLTIYDAGVVYAPSSIGDYVWLDQDQIGEQNANSVGIANIRLNLYRVGQTNEFITSTVSDVNGYYEFTQLNPGDYLVEVDQTTVPSMIKLIPNGVGTPQNDSDFDPTTSQSQIVNLQANTVNHDIDAGFVYKPVLLGDRVWLDKNRNGIQDANENGVANVHLKLYKYDDSNNRIYLVDTYTDSQGFYSFNMLNPYQFTNQIFTPYRYVLEVEEAGFYDVSPMLHVTNNDQDSDFHDESGTYWSDDITLSNTYVPSILTIDAALVYETGSIGDYVFEDDNRNGVYDGYETSLENVTVNLYQLIDNQFTLIDTTVTDQNGMYLFDALDPGDYQLEIIAPTNYALTLYQVGTLANQSSFCPTTQSSDDYAGLEAADCQGAEPNKTKTITLSPGENILYQDAGLQPKFGHIGDLIWRDDNQNGVQDTSEVGVSGVTLNLLNDLGDLVQSVQTDAQGYYQFNHVNPGTYSVEIQIPANYTLTHKNAGNIDQDSDFDLVTFESSQFMVNPGEHIETIDGGLIPGPSSIGDRVWLDLNRNGLQDSDELGIQDITVTLYVLQSDWQIVSSTQTDSLGYYLFEQLLPGTYKLSIDLPQDYALTFIETEDEINSDFCPSVQDSNDYKGLETVDCQGVQANQTKEIVLEPNQHVTNIDAGLQQKYASIGDYYWIDTNRNGFQDLNEPGVSHTNVYLLDHQLNTIQTATTSETGYYQFNQVEPGSYTIQFDIDDNYDWTTSHQGDTTIDSDVLETGMTDPITLTIGEHNQTIDAGVTPKYSTIGDYVWIDGNRNGIQDIGEMGLSNVAIHLYQKQNDAWVEIAQTTSNLLGYYKFTQLEPGDYRLSIDVPTSYTLTVLTNIDEQNSDFCPGTQSSDDFKGLETVDCGGIETGFTRTIHVTPNQTILTIDAGVQQQYASIGDLVWIDKNRDGIQNDALNQDVSTTVKLKLHDINGQIIRETITTLNQTYRFTQLEPGQYYLSYDVLDNYDSTTYTTQDALNNSDYIGQKTDLFTLTIGQHRTDLDLGLVEKYSRIGDYAWIDKNKNGIQDAEEVGLSGVEFKLKNSEGQVIATTVSDKQGFYQFNQLESGDYCLDVVEPNGYELTKPLVQDVQRDSDFIKGKSVCVSIGLNEYNQTIDAGFVSLKDLPDTGLTSTSYLPWVLMVGGIVVMKLSKSKKE